MRRRRVGSRIASVTAARLLLASVVTANVYAVSHVALSMRDSLVQYRSAATLSAQNLARLLDDGLTAVFDRIDLALLAVADEHEQQVTLGTLEAGAMRAFLERQRSRIEELVSLRIVDARGVEWAGAPAVAGRFDVSDREYFAALRSAPPGTRYVSKPLLGRMDQTPIVIVARRLSAPDGTFAGAILGAVSLDHLHHVISGVDVGPQGSVSLRYTDMSLVARTGPKGPNTELGNAKISRELQDIVTAGIESGTYEARTLTDGFERTFALRKLSHYPLYAIVGLARADYLAGWRRNAVRELVLLAVFVVFTVVVAGVGRRAGRSQQRAEEALTREKERLAVTLRSIGDGVIATDLERRVVLVNAAAERLTAWPAGEARGRPIDEVLRTTEHLRAASQPGIVTREVLLSRDGRKVAVAVTRSPIRDHGEREIGEVLILRDLTTVERTEEELARAQKLESLAVLAGGIAHDFNNLLTGIVGNISFARRETPAATEAGQALADAEAASLRARNLTRQLLTFSSGGAPVKKLVDLAAVVEETARFAAHGSATACHFELPPGLLAVVDEGQIGQVIQNLVLNGIQAMSSRGQLVVRGERVAVGMDSPLALEPGAYVRISIQDHGPGIPATALPRIFDPFFTTKPDGKGLGLSICHSIIRRHAGHIEVDSHVGEGTTFRVLLPAAADRQVAAERSPAASSEHRAGDRRVLVMDDEELVRSAAVRALRRIGYEAVAAKDGDEALALYSEARSSGRPFSAVLMDLTVPGAMGGKEAIARLREVDPAVVAVVCSGYSNDPVMASYAEHGFRAVLPKPYVVEDLEATLRRVIAG